MVDEQFGQILALSLAGEERTGGEGGEEAPVLAVEEADSGNVVCVCVCVCVSE